MFQVLISCKDPAHVYGYDIDKVSKTESDTEIRLGHFCVQRLCSLIKIRCIFYQNGDYILACRYGRGAAVAGRSTQQSCAGSQQPHEYRCCKSETEAELYS